MRENGEGLSDEQVELADQAAKAIREFQIPTYIVTGDDEKPPLEIFTRLNDAGRRLTKAEIFQALHSQTAGDAPMTLAAIGRGPAELGFGALDDDLVLRCVLAYRGGDIFRTDFAAEFKSADDQAETFAALAANLRDVVAFLRDVAEIPHAKLLPYSNVVPVLVRFIRLHGAPQGRAATLLRRWVWRRAVAGTHTRGQSVADLRGQIKAMQGSDPVVTAGALLERVPANTRFTVELDKVNFRQAAAKINILCLWSCEPREPATGAPVDIARLLDDGTRSGRSSTAPISRWPARSPTASSPPKARHRRCGGIWPTHRPRWPRATCSTQRCSSCWPVRRPPHFSSGAPTS